MKNLLLLLSLLLPTFALTQVPNGGLENWSGGLPVGWTINQAPGYIYVVQSAIAQTGASSARFQVVQAPNGVSCNPLVGPSSPVHGAIPTSFTFWYQLVATGGDSLWLGASVQETPYLFPFAQIYHPPIPLAASWTPITFPFVYTVNPGNPDTVRFDFQLVNYVNFQLHAGTYALLDNFSIDVPVGAETANPSFLKTSTYPNPANEEVYIAFVAPAPGDAVIQIMDVAGRVLMEREANVGQSGWFTERFDTRALAVGSYLALVRMGERVAELHMQVMR